MTKKPVCAVCRKRAGGILIDYATILQSMGYVGHKFAHTRCVVKIQQKALNLIRTRREVKNG